MSEGDLKELHATILKRVDIVADGLKLQREELLKDLPHLSQADIFVPSPFDYGGSISRAIDHTLLKPNAITSELKNLCEEAAHHNFFAVCVNGSRFLQAKQFLQELKCNTKTACVIGFPLGSSTTASKAFECNELVKLGADEIDMVLNIGNLIEQNYNYVLHDIREVVKAAEGKTVKVIFETSMLNKEQIIDAAILSVIAGAHFVKTSTGFGGGGAKLEDVRLMKLGGNFLFISIDRTVVGDKALVKASGGVKNFEDAKSMMRWAARIGTSSGVAIVSGQTANPTGY